MTVEQLIEKMNELRIEINPEDETTAPYPRIIIYSDGSGGFELSLWKNDAKHLDEGFWVGHESETDLETAFTTFAENVRLHLERKA